MRNVSLPYLYSCHLFINETLRVKYRMKIDLEKIDEGGFVIRDEYNKEYIAQLAESLKEDGQWNPIIVRHKPDGRYEVIAGHYRLQAAKLAGFKEIEATIRDIPDEYADILSLKTNMFRYEMSEREQGRVLSKIMQEYGFSQVDISRRLGVSSQWVRRRLRVALELHEKVAAALEKGLIGFQVAAVIAQIPYAGQPDFLNIIIERGIKDHTDAGVLRKQLLNDTIFTIGYQGYDITEFIDKLKSNKIDLVMDVRYSSESQYKPDFNGPILKRELERNNIKYEHKPEFGLPYIIQNPYKDGTLSLNCVRQWYKWHIDNETDFDDLLKVIKNTGNTALMCMEQYAKPKGDQEYACHRDILSDFLLKHKSEDKLLKFSRRVDL